MSSFNQTTTPVYTTHAIRQWEQRWLAQGNSSFGLMQQAAWSMSQYIAKQLDNLPKSGLRPSVGICCGAGNNGGDGYLIAAYLSKLANVVIFRTAEPASPDCQLAYRQTLKNIPVVDDIAYLPKCDVLIDAMFGSGLDKLLDEAMINNVNAYNERQAHLKIAIDIPSGLHPDRGVPMPVSTKNDITLCLMAQKLGLLTGCAKGYVGQIEQLSLIPPDDLLNPAALIDNTLPKLKPRDAHQHKGDFGSVIVIGGHLGMGGAALLSAEAAITLGAGRVTVMTNTAHHAAILARAPNLMLADINDPTDDIQEKIATMTVICLGMGFGRDGWAVAKFDELLAILGQQLGKTVILDADALWLLAEREITLPKHWICTPHDAEAARLLGLSAEDVQANRVGAIYALQKRYGGRWLLKGANTLTLGIDDGVKICTLGNAGMATAGMGDVLSGMIAGILAQDSTVPLSAIASLHAHSGDILAKEGLSVDVNHIAKTATQVLAS